MKTEGAAPAILFVYNRPEHTKATVNALVKNTFASDTDLYIFSDGPREGDETSVQEVRTYLKKITGFKSVKIIEREKNWGLAASIIDGVTQVINQHGKAIVLEDDIVTSPHFLSFMNNALNHYQVEKRVWHISGWNYPIEGDGLGDAFLWRVMNCWGWATWADRWQHFSKEPERLKSEWTAEQKKRFDLEGSGVFWSQVEANLSKKINTWAIFWYATIFEHDGLCLNPTLSYVENIGHDGSGENCGINTLFSVSELNDRKDIKFPHDLAEKLLAVFRVSVFIERAQPKLTDKIWKWLSGNHKNFPNIKGGVNVLYYGLQRSGTNYLDALLRKNYNVHLLNSNEDRRSPLQKHCRLYNNKNLIPELKYCNDINIYTFEDFEALFKKAPQYYIVISKDPYSWYLSYCNWAEKCSWPNVSHHYIEEYNAFYGQFIYLSKSTDKFIFIKYIDLLLKPETVLNNMECITGMKRKFFSKNILHPIKVEQSMAFGKDRLAYYRDELYLNCYDKETLSKINELLDLSVVTQLGYYMVDIKKDD